MAIEPQDIRIGTARWNIPLEPGMRADPLLKKEGSLPRYARVLDASEINSSFHRHHMPKTYARWGGSTPTPFRFAVKIPKAITHGAKLELGASLPVLDRFLSEMRHLEFKAGPLLVQLPPSFAFQPDLVDRFLTALRTRWSGSIAVEPRHATWFEPEADQLLIGHCAARVAADPVRAPGADEPGGWPGLVYVRLHGSPRVYYSSYEPDYLDGLIGRLREYAARPETEALWCIFDNTASGAALGNALDVRRQLSVEGGA